MGRQTDPTFYVLKFFRAGGVHPDVKVTPFLVFLFWMNCSIVSAIIVLATIGILVGFRANDINMVVECLQSTFIYLHIFFNQYVLFRYKKLLSRILSQRSNFLEMQNFGPELQERYEGLLMKTSRFVNVFMVLTSFVVFSFYMQPYLTGGDLPVTVYVPEGWYYYIHFAFWPLAPCIVVSIYGSAGLFCAISVPVIIQFKLLTHKIEEWKIEQNQEDFKKNLKELVDHQNFLFEYCNDVNEFNNGIFINQFLFSVGIFCLQLFVVSQRGFKLWNKIKCINHSIMEIIETGMYCFNAELVSDASEEVGNAAYNSQWYQTDDLEIKNAITIIIARAQKRIVFNGFGLVYINLKTFTQIFKTALSFYSYLNNLVLN